MFVVLVPPYSSDTLSIQLVSERGEVLTQLGPNASKLLLSDVFTQSRPELSYSYHVTLV